MIQLLSVAEHSFLPVLALDRFDTQGFRSMSGGTGGGFRVPFLFRVSCLDSGTLSPITNRGSIKYSLLLLLLLTVVLVAWYFVLDVGIRPLKFIIATGVINHTVTCGV